MITEKLAMVYYTEARKEVMMVTLKHHCLRIPEGYNIREAQGFFYLMHGREFMIAIGMFSETHIIQAAIDGILGKEVMG
jgi:hypothetical protein